MDFYHHKTLAGGATTISGITALRPHYIVSTPKIHRAYVGKMIRMVDAVHYLDDENIQRTIRQALVADRDRQIIMNIPLLSTGYLFLRMTEDEAYPFLHRYGMSHADNEIQAHVVRNNFLLRTEEMRKVRLMDPVIDISNTLYLVDGGVAPAVQPVVLSFENLSDLINAASGRDEVRAVGQPPIGRNEAAVGNNTWFTDSGTTNTTGAYQGRVTADRATLDLFFRTYRNRLMDNALYAEIQTGLLAMFNNVESVQLTRSLNGHSTITMRLSGGTQAVVNFNEGTVDISFAVPIQIVRPSHTFTFAQPLTGGTRSSINIVANGLNYTLSPAVQGMMDSMYHTNWEVVTTPTPAPAPSNSAPRTFATEPNILAVLHENRVRIMNSDSSIVAGAVSEAFTNIENVHLNTYNGNQRVAVTYRDELNYTHVARFSDRQIQSGNL